MHQVPSSWKQCATCGRWAGQRKLNQSRQAVEVESTGAKGECLGGRWNNQDVHADFSCDTWQPWGILK
jgi:hypothetical protein